MQPQFNQGLRTREPKQPNSINGGGDVVHTNSYTTREHVINTYMNTLVHKEQVLIKGVK